LFWHRLSVRQLKVFFGKDHPEATKVTFLKISKEEGKQIVPTILRGSFIYPVTSFRLALKSVEDGLASILEHGFQVHLLDKMQHRKRLYEILRYEDYNSFDKDIFNFRG